VNVAASRSGKGLLWVSFWFLVLFLYAPLLILVIFSFNAREFVSFPWEGFTLRWYQQFVGNSEILRALRTSGVIALITSAVTSALAIPAALAVGRRRFFAKGLVSGFLLAPLVIPLVVLGTALLILFNLIGVPTGRLTIMVAHVVICLPFAILVILPRLARIPIELEEASRDLGATWWTAFRTITFPLLAPAVVSAALISFVISFDELVLASFVGGQTTTFPLYLWSQLRLPRQLPQVIAVAVAVLVVSTLVVVFSEVLRRRANARLESETRIVDEGEVVSV
jgi:spermidine/putrescine transport system permease protein